MTVSRGPRHHILCLGASFWVLRSHVIETGPPRWNTPRQLCEGRRTAPTRADVGPPAAHVIETG